MNASAERDTSAPLDEPEGSQEEGSQGKEEGERSAYVSTPMGLFTERGIWFHIPEEALRSYAGPVLDHVSVDTLVDWSSTWLRSPRVLTLWLLPAILWFSASQAWPWAAGVGIALAFHVLWTLAGPSLVSTKMVRAFRWLDEMLLQALMYVFTLSMLASSGAHAETVVGLTGFVLLRYGLVDRAVAFLIRPLRSAIYDLPPADQILRAFLIRIALNQRLPIPQLDDMASEMLDRWGSHKS